MLSADMIKEGLFGRTLTLKLKTASFEVLPTFCFSDFYYIDLGYFYITLADIVKASRFDLER